MSQRFLCRWFGRDVESVAGLQGRLDRIPTVGLYHTRGGERLETIREDDVTQSSGAAYFQTSVQWTPRVRTTAGVRGDLYRFDVKSDDPANSGARTAALASPKLGLVLGPWRNTELYANWGLGLPQQRRPRVRADARPQDGGPGRSRRPHRAREGRGGGRAHASSPAASTASVALWGLDIASELLFVGDAGTTEAEPTQPARGLRMVERLHAHAAG